MLLYALFVTATTTTNTAVFQGPYCLPKENKSKLRKRRRNYRLRRGRALADWWSVVVLLYTNTSVCQQLYLFNCSSINYIKNSRRQQQYRRCCGSCQQQQNLLWQLPKKDRRHFIFFNLILISVLATAEIIIIFYTLHSIVYSDKYYFLMIWLYV